MTSREGFLFEIHDEMFNLLLKKNQITKLLNLPIFTSLGKIRQQCGLVTNLRNKLTE